MGLTRRRTLPRLCHFLGHLLINPHRQGAAAVAVASRQGTIIRSLHLRGTTPGLWVFPPRRSTGRHREQRSCREKPDEGHFLAPVLRTVQGRKTTPASLAVCGRARVVTVVVQPCRRRWQQHCVARRRRHSHAALWAHFLAAAAAAPPPAAAAAAALAGARLF